MSPLAVEVLGNVLSSGVMWLLTLLLLPITLEGVSDSEEVEGSDALLRHRPRPLKKFLFRILCGVESFTSSLVSGAGELEGAILLIFDFPLLTSFLGLFFVRIFFLDVFRTS